MRTILLAFSNIPKIQIITIALIIILGIAYTSHAFYILNVDQFTISKFQELYLVSYLNNFIFFIIIALAHYTIFILFAIYGKLPYVLLIILESIIVIIFIMTLFGGYEAVGSVMLTKYGEVIDFPVVRILSVITLGAAIYGYMTKCRFIKL